MREDYDRIIDTLSDDELIVWRLNFNEWPPGTSSNRLTRLEPLLGDYRRERVRQQADRVRHVRDVAEEAV
jgi:hypothetical protein